ncbi:protocatechuate 3,4-dioxygenase subunit alpha [Streptomyces sp. NBC_00829]|uniref:protocatechuate 3,4-dioxygenase subunit alpha n=1 Tax=Streptomyces sp. NBC_00829 TaxID=2903679 RepID=UPI003869246E|nr:protocatechuate 3,4-dioxygenase subunit alpha [Streptomyces sp. NBC_00829]
MSPLPTPSHTVGPFFGYALAFPGGGDIVPSGHPESITLHGQVYDGAGAPVPDAIVEFWQTDSEGSPARPPGSMRRDPVTGGFLGRNGVDFTGFGRVPTDADGHFTVRTLPPGGPAPAPYISVCVFARGLTHHLFTRAYFPGAEDRLLSSLAPERRATLMATAEGHHTFRFDIRLQGEEETVFLDFD